MNRQPRRLLLFILILIFLTGCVPVKPPTQPPIVIPPQPSPVTPTNVIEPTETAVQPLQTAIQLPTATPVVSRFVIKSIDVMKFSQDVVGNPYVNAAIVKQETDMIKQANANFVAISPPTTDPITCKRDSTFCSDTLKLVHQWVTAIRGDGMHVWFRQKPASFEAWYNQPKNADPYYQLQSVVDYIKTNPDLFEDGDIYSPFTEPQNGGVIGINCSQNCMFQSIQEFNQWLRDVMAQVTAAFKSINKNVTVGMFGFDGFVAWGDRNPDRQKLGQNAGFLEPATIAAMGNNVTIDHYFPADADPDAEFQKIRNYFGPTVSICIGEWGAGSGESAERVAEVMQAALDNGITCFNYWHLGPLIPLDPKRPRTEALLDADMNPLDIYFVVQQFYGR